MFFEITFLFILTFFLFISLTLMSLDSNLNFSYISGEEKHKATVVSHRSIIIMQPRQVDNQEDCAVWSSLQGILFSANNIVYSSSSFCFPSKLKNCININKYRLFVYVDAIFLITFVYVLSVVSVLNVSFSSFQHQPSLYDLFFTPSFLFYQFVFVHTPS